MLDFDALVLGPVYDTFGAPAVLTIGPNNYQLTVVDYTKGIAVEEDGVGIQTVRPVADVRRARLAAIGVQLDDLVDASLELGGVNWRIKSFIENEAEFRLILMQA
jgi:hypothetical protein